jgi:molecular chaperone IbpA
MTRTLSLRSLDIPSTLQNLHRAGIGFDSIFNDLARQVEQQTNYPPHNIVKISDDEFFIEIAIAGFNEDEIGVHLDNRTLSISGKKLTSEDHEYLYRGLSSRDFEKQFTLAEYVEVTSADVKNGILRLNLQRQIPDDKKPRIIKLNYLS